MILSLVYSSLVPCQEGCPTPPTPAGLPLNSEQKHRWVATALLDIEPRLRRVRGYRFLPQLRAALEAYRQEQRQPPEVA